MSNQNSTVGCMPSAYITLLNPFYYWIMWQWFRGTKPGEEPDWRKMPLGVPLLTRRWQIVVGAAVSVAFNLAIGVALIAVGFAAFAAPAAALPWGAAGLLIPQAGVAVAIPILPAVAITAVVVAAAGYGVYRACKSDTPKKRGDRE